MLIDEQTYVPGQASREATLKPSQAMRIGAALRPKCEGRMFVGGKSCAIGAMWEGYGNSYDPGKNYLSAWKALPFDFYRTGISPGDIWAKNDSGWSREQIADWLETQGL